MKIIKLLRRALFRLIILTVLLSLPLVGTTNAVFYDEESSLANNFSAASLDFSLRDTSNVVLTSPFFNLGGFKPGDSQVKALRVKKDGGLDFKYDGRFVKTGGEDNFCQALQLKAKLGATTKYSGNLDGFILTPALTIDGSGQDDWEFILSLDSNDPALQNKTCQFNFVFKGWQTDSDGTWGFIDEEVLGNIVASGDWTAPYVKIESPSHSDTLSGAVNIFGTVTDNDPHHYWLAAENALTHQSVVGFPGVVNENNSFTNRLLYRWDTTKVADGNYIIKLEARDSAGNKDPDLAPVPNDPEDPLDSVDWITVIVDNPPTQPTGLTIYKGHNSATWVGLGCGGTTDDTRITVKWNSNPESDIAYYWFGTQFNSHHAKVYPPASEYHGNMTPGHNPYYYTVIAVDTTGHESPISESCTLLLTQPSPTPTEAPPVARVVINEVYYRGGSNAEWVELYNAGNAPIDLENWTISDNDSTDTIITTSAILGPDMFAVVVGGNNSTQVIASGAMRIVLSNAEIGSGLNNSGDRLTLRDSAAAEIDFVAWKGFVAGWDLEAGVTESIARKTKGVDTNSMADWQVLTTPNPGTNPHPSTEPTVDFTLRSDKHAVSFQVNNIKKFKTLSYEITYDAKPVEKQIAGTINLTNEDSFARNDLILGTCSSFGKVCVYDWGMTKITLRVVLTLPNSQTTEIIKEIAY